MVLNDTEIRERIAFSKLVELPGTSYTRSSRYHDCAIQPASYDLRLSSVFRRIKALRWLNRDKRYVDLDDEVEYAEIISDEIVIQPGEFLLGASEEVLHIPDELGVLLSPRSSFGRAGLSMSFSTWINPGYNGRIAIEMFNAGPNPVKLRSGIRVLQAVFMGLTDKAEISYFGKYQNETENMGSRLREDFPWKGQKDDRTNM